MQCPRCQTMINKMDARFCPSCGAPLGDLPAPSPPSRQEAGGRKFPLPLLVVSALLGVLLTFGFYSRDAIARVLPFLNPSNNAHAAELAPEDTCLFLVFNPGLGQLKNFNRLKDIYMGIPEFEKEWQNLAGDFTDEFKLDFTKDVEPWLGREAAFIARDYDSLDQDSFLLAISTTSEKKTATSLEKLRRASEREGTVFRERTYEGVNIVTGTDAGSSPFAYALHGGFLLLSANEDAIYSAIDMTKDRKKTNLAQNSNYQAVMNKLPKDRSGACYMDLTPFLEALARETMYGAGMYAGMYLEELKAASGLGFSLAFADEGVRVDFALGYDPQKLTHRAPPPADSSGVVKAAGLIPHDAIAFAGASNLQYTLAAAMDQILRKPGMGDFNQEMYYFERETGINLQRDFISWLGSEIGMALVPCRDGMLAREIPVGILTVIAVQDMETAQNALSTVTNLLRDEGAEVRYADAGGRDVVCLYDYYSGETAAAYGFTNDYLVIGTAQGLVQDAIAARGPSLTESSSYREAMAGGLSGLGGCVYVDMAGGIDLAYQSMDTWEREEFRGDIHPFVAPIQSLGFQQNRTEDDFVTASMLVSIK